jgi:hypothetical protein
MFVVIKAAVAVRKLQVFVDITKDGNSKVTPRNQVGEIQDGLFRIELN